MNRIVIVFLAWTLLWVACEFEPSEGKSTSSTPESIDSSLPWSERLALSIIDQYPDVWTVENDKTPVWNYKIGLLMTSFEHLYGVTQDQVYEDYILKYANSIVKPSGEIVGYELEKYNIDMVNPGKFLFHVYENTKDDRYLNAINLIRKQLDSHPRTNAGGFWHKKIYPNQMWLDGLYMGTPFYARYTKEQEGGANFDDIIHQFEVIQSHLVDENTGLLYHAWDESKQMDWADDDTGRSPGFWARSLGWYAMAIVDVLDYLPKDHKGYPQLVSYLNELSIALAQVQDQQSGVWYQVPDQPDGEGNYIESSASCMIVYAFAKGVRKGYLPNSYKSIAQKAYDGIIDNFIKVDENGLVHITQICGSAGLGGDPYRDGTYEYYVGETIKSDNLHGLGPFILASIEMERSNLR